MSVGLYDNFYPNIATARCPLLIIPSIFETARSHHLIRDMDYVYIPTVLLTLWANVNGKYVTGMYNPQPIDGDRGSTKIIPHG